MFVKNAQKSDSHWTFFLANGHLLMILLWRIETRDFLPRLKFVLWYYFPKWVMVLIFIFLKSLRKRVFVRNNIKLIWSKCSLDQYWSKTGHYLKWPRRSHIGDICRVQTLLQYYWRSTQILNLLEISKFGHLLTKQVSNSTSSVMWKHWSHGLLWGLNKIYWIYLEFLHIACN